MFFSSGSCSLLDFLPFWVGPVVNISSHNASLCEYYLCGESNASPCEWVTLLHLTECEFNVIETPSVTVLPNVWYRCQSNAPLHVTLFDQTFPSLHLTPWQKAKGTSEWFPAAQLRAIFSIRSPCDSLESKTFHTRSSPFLYLSIESSPGSFS